MLDKSMWYDMEKSSVLSYGENTVQYIRRQ